MIFTHGVVSMNSTDTIFNMSPKPTPGTTRTTPGYSVWAGPRLSPSDGMISVGPMTAIAPLDHGVPHLVFAAGSAGPGATVVVRAEDVAGFVNAHRDLIWITPNSACVFWLLEHHLRTRGELDALSAWWSIAAENRLRDVVLLDALVRLARDDSAPTPRDLATIAFQVNGPLALKSDPDGLRDAGAAGRGLADVDPGVVAAAVDEVVATRAAYLALRSAGTALAGPYVPDGSVPPTPATSSAC